MLNTIFISMLSLFSSGSFTKALYHHSLRSYTSSSARFHRIRYFGTSIAGETSETSVDSIVELIKRKGDEIRDLKAQKADVNNLVQDLLQLKTKYQELTGNPYDNSGKPKKEAKKVVSNQKTAEIESESIMITPRSVDYSAW